MPPVIAAVATTAITAFTTGFVVGGVTITGMAALLTTTALKYFAINAALGFALNALAPKAAIPAGVSYQANAIDAVADRQVVYGRKKVGGVVVYKEATNNNQYLHKVVALTGHEIQSFDQIYLNDELLTLDGTGNVTSPSKYNGYVRIKTYFGSTTQAADSDLVGESAGKWTSQCQLLGVAYIYARFKYNSDKFPNGEPIITAVIKGKKVYDPRTGLTAWTDNSALCLRDYITSDFGLAEVAANVDDTLFSAAANICDENVTLKVGGTEKRYTTNGAFITSTQPTDVISSLSASMGGLIWYTQGKWRVKAAAWSTPELAFDEDDFRSAISISTRNSRRDNFNIVRGKFCGEESNWTDSDYPEIKSATFLAVDGGLESSVDVALPMTATSTTAQRIAKIALYRNREQITVSANFGLRAMNVQVGDVIYLSYARAGWTNKTFEVQNWQLVPSQGGDIQIQMNLRELSSAVFDWNADEAAFDTNNTTLHDPFYVPPIGLALTSDVRSFRESLTNVIYINVTALAADLSNIERVEVQAKKHTETVWTPVGTGQTGIYEFLSVDDSLYDIRARAWNFMAVKGDWTEQINFQVLGLAAPPDNVQTFRANLNGPTINLEWQAVPDLDLSYYKIRHAIEESGASYANATTAVEKVSRPATSVTIPTRPGTYTIKAYDKTGNASTLYSSVVVPSTALDAFATTSTIVDSPTFSGTKTNCSVTSSELRLTSFSTSANTGTYEFTGYIDTGSPRKVRSRINIAVNRFATASGLWDDMTGLWDTWSGLWDDWTGAVQNADIDVVSYISVTQDDPAGSPVWTDFKPFKAGDYYGRAFKFKVELTSSTAGITPSISALTALVQY